MRYRHLIFDIDGTLVNSEDVALGSLQRTIRETIGIEKSIEELAHFFGIPSFKTVQMLPFPDRKAAFELWEYYYREMYHLIVPFEGVEAMIEKLHGLGFKMGIVTSRCMPEFNADPHTAKWIEKGYFTIYVTSEDCQQHKPAPDPLYAYMHKAGAAPEECLYIGDNIVDSKCAAAAGVDFVLADWKKRADGTIDAIRNVHSAEEMFAACTME